MANVSTLAAIYPIKLVSSQQQQKAHNQRTRPGVFSTGARRINYLNPTFSRHLYAVYICISPAIRVTCPSSPLAFIKTLVTALSTVAEPEIKRDERIRKRVYKSGSPIQ